MGLWKYITTVTIDDVNTTIETLFQSTTLRDVKANSDGAYSTWFNNTIAAHKTAVLATPSLEGVGAYVTVPGGWLTAPSNATTITTNPVTIHIPTGNGGTFLLKLYPTGATAQYKKNSGSFTTFTDNTGITLADGDVLTLKATSANISNSVTGSLVDVTSGQVVDFFNLSSTTP